MKNNIASISDQILESRKGLPGLYASSSLMKQTEDAAEGGCGVLGLAANIPVAGRHVLTASTQMHNRGNSKGGGIAMVGLDPAQAGVDTDTLGSHYMLQIALLDQSVRAEVEAEFITPYLDVAKSYELPHIEDYRLVDGLDVRPPDVWRYFVRVKPDVLAEFASKNGLSSLPDENQQPNPRVLEDEFIYQNSYKMNVKFYASLGEKRAFVLSHGRNLSVVKIVGYAEQVVAYYKLEEQTAHVWIAHQRYPTKGRVWHPGGAHPFIGLNEALVHNGDFANYYAVSEYLRQRNIGQLFLTDTEVSVQLFDLWDRVYGYPLEITLEAMAPTTEHDFAMLSPEKQTLYRAVQRTHIHASPDGPWFFIVARSKTDEDRFELLGITDTSMLRPQVFALYENTSLDLPHASGKNKPGDESGEKVQIGLIASERQAINACMRSLAREDDRFKPLADKYWNARGGSHTDGGAFRFSLTPTPSSERDGKKASKFELTCTNKFGQPVSLMHERVHAPKILQTEKASEEFRTFWIDSMTHAYEDGDPLTAWDSIKSRLSVCDWNELALGLTWLLDFGKTGADEWQFARETLTILRDRRTDTGIKKRASMLTLVDEALVRLFDHPIQDGMAHINWQNHTNLVAPSAPDATLVLDTLGFPAEGDESAARFLVNANKMGWKRFVVYNLRGGRFAAVGLGRDTKDVLIDLYGDPGDYTGSGLDGAEIQIHADGQDQLGQIMKEGKLVIHGDVGQTFLYGAKGGEIYVLGSAAGRPLINAVGKPRAVINGTCLDYLAESFMAGDPSKGGGFVILNGVGYTEDGKLTDLPSPYPGGNLFSLASGGAIFIRDPRRQVEADQLNGGVFAELTDADWTMIEPYLIENEKLFGIKVEDLLTVDGKYKSPSEVYRKVRIYTSETVLVETENR